ncbi:MAG: hypothetical protein V4537_18170 [Pseudomonadota bacterium]
MIDAKTWAKRLRMARSESIARDAEVETGFVTRAEGVVRDAQLDMVNECLRIAQRAMDAAAPRHRAALGVVVDRLADLALDVKQRQPPKAGG